MWIEEISVPGETYNHPKIDEGYNDDNIYEEPYRHITNWFLARKDCADTMRKSFPYSQPNFAQLALHGELEPATEKQENNENFKVVISNIRNWMFDRHREDRGIWVLSERAWYRLKQPCTKIILRPNGTTVSQYELHHVMQAKVGLLSNIIDMMSDSRGYLQPALVKFHAAHSPEESYKSLCPTSDELKENPSLSKEPYDFSLLRTDPGFIRTNLYNLDTNLSHECKFIQGLKRLEGKIKKLKRKRGKSQCYGISHCIASTKASCERCNRWPWGEQKLDSSGEWRNNMVELSNLKLNFTSGSVSLLSSQKKKEEDTDSDVSVVLNYPCTNEQIDQNCQAKRRRKIMNFKKEHDEGDCSENSDSKLSTNSRLEVFEKKTMHPPISPTIGTNSETKPASIRPPLSSVVHDKVNDVEKCLMKYFEDQSGCIKETMIADFSKEIIHNCDNLSPETMLTCIDKLRKSSISAKKALFDTSNVEESGVRGIFIIWLENLMDIITKRPFTGEQSEEMIVGSILKLLCSFTFIRKKSQLAKIKEWFDVDLCMCVEKVDKVSTQNQDKKLGTISKAAQSFLNNIKAIKKEKKSFKGKCSEAKSKKSACDVPCLPQKSSENVLHSDFAMSTELKIDSKQEYSSDEKNLIKVLQSDNNEICKTNLEKIVTIQEFQLAKNRNNEKEKKKSTRKSIVATNPLTEPKVETPSLGTHFLNIQPNAPNFPIQTSLVKSSLPILLPNMQTIKSAVSYGTESQSFQRTQNVWHENMFDNSGNFGPYKMMNDTKNLQIANGNHRSGFECGVDGAMLKPGIFHDQRFVGHSKISTHPLAFVHLTQAKQISVDTNSNNFRQTTNLHGSMHITTSEQSRAQVTSNDFLQTKLKPTFVSTNERHNHEYVSSTKKSLVANEALAQLKNGWFFQEGDNDIGANHSRKLKSNDLYPMKVGQEGRNSISHEEARHKKKELSSPLENGINREYDSTSIHDFQENYFHEGIAGEELMEQIDSYDEDEYVNVISM